MLFQSIPRPQLTNEALIVVLSYLYRTRHLGLTFGGATKMPTLATCKPEVDYAALKSNHGLYCWSDASYGEERSHTGYAVQCT